MFINFVRLLNGVAVGAIVVVACIALAVATGAVIAAIYSMR